MPLAQPSPATAHDASQGKETNPASASFRRPTCTTRSLSFLRQTLPVRELTGPLLVVTLATGILDATTYADFGVFASNQTG
jgi:hypothetical protein